MSASNASRYCQPLLPARKLASARSNTVLTRNQFHGERGSSVGIIAAQSIGEPEPSSPCVPSILVVSQGCSRIPKSRFAPEVKLNTKAAYGIGSGNNIVLNKTGSILILDADDREIENYKIVVGSVLTKGDGERIKRAKSLRCGIRTISPLSLKKPVVSDSVT